MNFRKLWKTKSSDNEDPPPTSKPEDESQKHSEDNLQSSKGEDNESSTVNDTEDSTGLKGKDPSGKSLDADEESRTVNDAKDVSEDLSRQKEKGPSRKSSEDRTKNVKGKKKKSEFRLSDRMEYLSRPKKDILDSMVEGRLDGAMPEQAYPSWKIMPLPTKLPFDNCPIPVTSTKLAENLFLPPPGNDFDREDENNLLLPFISYDSLHDPYLTSFLRSNHILDHLKEENFITDSERTICTLEDINKYRTYQRRILAAEAQKVLRDLDEEFRKKRAEGMDAKIKRDMQRYLELRTQGTMRRWIKNTVASIKDSSMKNQMIRDARVLNCQIRRQEAQRARISATQERYERLYLDHMRKKYDDTGEKRRKAHLAYAKKDLEVLEKLCKRQEQEKLKRKKKLDEFWKRKSEFQKKWLEQGEELERKRLEEKVKNLQILKKTGRLPVLFRKKNSPENSADGKHEKRSTSDVRQLPKEAAGGEESEKPLEVGSDDSSDFKTGKTLEPEAEVSGLETEGETYEESPEEGSAVENPDSEATGVGREGDLDEDATANKNAQ